MILLNLYFMRMFAQLKSKNYIKLQLKSIQFLYKNCFEDFILKLLNLNPNQLSNQYK